MNFLNHPKVHSRPVLEDIWMTKNCYINDHSKLLLLTIYNDSNLNDPRPIERYCIQITDMAKLVTFFTCSKKLTVAYPALSRDSGTTNQIFRRLWDKKGFFRFSLFFFTFSYFFPFLSFVWLWDMSPVSTPLRTLLD